MFGAVSLTRRLLLEQDLYRLLFMVQTLNGLKLSNGKSLYYTATVTNFLFTIKVLFRQEDV